MAEEILYQFQQIMDIGDDLISAAENFQGRVDKLKDDVNQTQQGWEGDASDAFAAQFFSWLEEASHTADELREIGNILIVVRNRYKSIELDVQDQWGRDA